MVPPPMGYGVPPPMGGPPMGMPHHRPHYGGPPMPHRAQGRGHPAHGVPGNPNAGPPVTVFVGNITERAQVHVLSLFLRTFYS